MKSFPPFRLDEVNQCLWRGTTRVSLMPKPFAVLRHLVDHPGQLVTQEQLLAAIWPETYVQPEVLRRYILEIRRALGDSADAPQFIQTFPKRGYEFIAPVVDDSVAAIDAGASLLPLVGRESALADLSRWLTAAVKGRRQVVFVVGEPGIGKTSLVDAFQYGSGGVAHVLLARGQSVEGFGGKEAYYPLLEAIGQLTRGPSKTLVVETLAAAAPTWLVQYPALVKPEHKEALQREIAGATRERMVRELCEAVEVITRTAPLVLILEDLQWVDHATLDVLSVMARRREAAKLLVVGTLRPAELILTESPLKALKHDLLVHRLCHELHLERLRETDVADYVAQAYAPADLPPELASTIYRHSDGNPLFMVAMLDHLAKKGTLSQRDGVWRLTTPVEVIDPEVPETLKQMLEIQLQHSSEREQQLLKVASVAGESFTAWSVSTMIDSDMRNVEDVCETLVDRQQFLKAAGPRELSGVVSTTEYRFAHALYREVLYRRLNPTERVLYHRRLANGLEQLRPGAAPEMAAEIALHFEEGHEIDRAVRYLVLAAHNATRRYAHQQAISVLAHARGLLSRLAHARAAPLELKILERMGNEFYALGDLAASAATYESMAILAGEAGLLAAQADALMRLPHPAATVPFFMKAIQLDPDFVAAYTTLSRIYSNLGETHRAKEFATRAYERRDRADARERLSLTYQYHFEVTGDQSRAAETLEEWKCAFPFEHQPVNSLAVMYNLLGDFERAVHEGEEAVSRNRWHGYPYSNLAHAYCGAGRFSAAQSTAEQAVALEIETLPTRRLLYQLAVMSGDHERAKQHREWARDQPREFEMVRAQAHVAAWAGKVGEARRLYEEAARMADSRDLREVGSSHLAWGIAMELAYGNSDAAVELARRVLARRPGYDPELRAALALASGGFCEEAESIATRLEAANPNHTLINNVLVPMVKAAVAIARAESKEAVAALTAAAPYELGFIAALAPIYLRGEACLMLGSGQDAGAEFQRILDHRGSDPFSPLHALAPLGLARAHRLAGDHAASRAAYERFLTAWRDADPDVPVLLCAREEYEGLQLAR